MKIAHLILCHSNPYQVERMIKAMQHRNASFYIHVDKKSNIAPFLYLEQWRNVHFVKSRVKVSWGAYSVVQATLNGMEEILSSGLQYDYINLLSGQDYPLKSAEEIHDFLAGNRGKIFMETLSVAHEWTEAQCRIEKYHLTDYNFKGKHLAEKAINGVMPKRKMPLGMTPVGRSQWFTMPVDCARYVLNFLAAHKQVARFFKHTWAPDEMIFQTIVYNSHFRSRMVNDNLRHIDWSEGNASPKTFTLSDFGALVDSEKLFSRKFNMVKDIAVLDYIDAIISGNVYESALPYKPVRILPLGVLTPAA
jgi:Core-2/I-Branching enzyme